MSLTGDEINYVIYQYLKESNFAHSAFALYHESRLKNSSLEKKALEPGRLVQVLRKGLLFIQVEQALKKQAGTDGVDDANLATKSNIEVDPPPRLLDDIVLNSKDGSQLPLLPLTPNTPGLAVENALQDSNSKDVMPGIAAGPSAADAKIEDRSSDVESNPKGTKRQKTTASSVSRTGNRVSFSTSSLSGSDAIHDQIKDHVMEIDPALTMPTAAAAMQAESSTASQSEKPTGPQSDVLFLKGHTSEIVSAAWNPSATSVLVTGGGDASARIWDVSMAPNQDRILTANHNCRHLPALPDQKTVSCLDWHPEGSLLATGSMDGQARLWTPEGDLHAVSASHGNAIYALKFNPAGTLFVTVSQDTNVIASDLSGRKKASWSIHPGSAMDVDWLDADTFATCSKDVKICRASSPGNVVAVFKGHTSEINVVRWHGSGDGLLASCGDEGEVRIWRYDTTKPGQMDKEETKAIHVFRGPQEMYCMRWQPWTKESSQSESRILAAGSFDGVVRCFDARTGSTLHTLMAHEEHIYSIAFSPTHPWLLGTVSLDRRLILWDVASGVKVMEYTAAGGILELAWKADGTQLALCTAAKMVPLLTIDADAFVRQPKIHRQIPADEPNDLVVPKDEAAAKHAVMVDEAEVLPGEQLESATQRRAKSKNGLEKK